jgi:hypothetical protein
MNYLSGGKKSILGTRLSSRYLSSDAFTSSTGKTGGRSISRLGSLLGRGSTKKFSGTGQRVGLFELKNIFFKFLGIVTCLIVIGYTIPFTRYAVHTFFIRHAQGVVYPVHVSDENVSALREGEVYVSPVFGKTDRFVFKHNDVVYNEGLPVYDFAQKVLIGTLLYASSTHPYIVLLSEVGQKNTLFAKDKKDISETVLDATSTHTDAFSSAIFEGFGYGQMRAQVPPQEEIAIDTVLYARTEQGLIPAAQVSYIEKDTGSTFTNMYAQILVPPFQLYKVRIGDI